MNLKVNNLIKQYLFILVFILSIIFVQAQNIHAVKVDEDYDTPYSLTNIGGTLFFRGHDATHGRELWKSDGTVTGTVMVKDINPGSGNSDIIDGFHYSRANINGTLFFTAYTPTHGRELWKSDGTSLGTVMVKDIRPGSADSYVRNIININNTAYFTAYGVEHGQELWKSDGTATGTVLVKDINLGASDSNLNSFTNFQNILYFKANDGIHGQELWKSDGTAAGTIMVKDIYPGNYSPSWTTTASEIFSSESTLYFLSSDPIHGKELWKSDGTAAGTVMVKDIYEGIYDSKISGMISSEGTLYFTANDGIHGYELWKSDGTASGTDMVKDIYPGSSSGSAFQKQILEGTLYFRAEDATHGQELWKSDGTAAGTVMVKDIYPGIYDSYALPQKSLEGTLYFTARDGIHGYELWKSDGTAAGTVMVKDMFNTSNGAPSQFTKVDDMLFFETSTNSLYGKGTYLMTFGSCTLNNKLFKYINYSIYATVDPVFNSQVQTTTNTKTCHCDIFNKLISTTEATGTNPFVSISTNKVFINRATPSIFVQRHYEIAPDSDIETATGKITLYFTQEEFNNYNALQTDFLLPIEPTDTANKANMIIELRTGLSSGSFGVQATYPGEPQFIDPDDDDIIWNALDSRWEVSFNTKGFGGFWLTTSKYLSINEINKEIITIYPIPSNGKIQIKGLKKDEDYKVYSLIGKKVLSGKVSNNESIDISILQRGIYFLNLKKGIVKKIIKK